MEMGTRIYAARIASIDCWWLQPWPFFFHRDTMSHVSFKTQNSTSAASSMVWKSWCVWFVNFFYSVPSRRWAHDTQWVLLYASKREREWATVSIAHSFAVRSSSSLFLSAKCINCNVLGGADCFNLLLCDVSRSVLDNRKHCNEKKKTSTRHCSVDLLFVIHTLAHPSRHTYTCIQSRFPCTSHKTTRNMQFSALVGWMVRRDGADAIDRPFDAHTHPHRSDALLSWVYFGVSSYSIFESPLSAICFTAPTLFHFKLFLAIIMAVNSNKFYFVVCWRLRQSLRTKNLAWKTDVCNCAKCIHLMIVSLADNSQPQWIAERDAYMWRNAHCANTPASGYSLYFSLAAKQPAAAAFVWFGFKLRTCYIIRSRWHTNVFHCQNEVHFMLYAVLSLQRPQRAVDIHRTRMATKEKTVKWERFVFCLNFIYLFF